MKGCRGIRPGNLGYSVYDNRTDDGGMPGEKSDQGDLVSVMGQFE